MAGLVWPWGQFKSWIHEEDHAGYPPKLHVQRCVSSRDSMRFPQELVESKKDYGPLLSLC